MLDDKTIQNVEYIKLNTKRMAEALESIAQSLSSLQDTNGNSYVKFLNWNLGKIVAHLLNDKKTLKEITEAEKEGKGEEKTEKTGTKSDKKK